MDGKVVDDSSNVNTFDEFDLVSSTDISHIIAKVKRPATSWDVLPSGLLDATADFIGPSITSIVNCSLSTGIFPSCLKQAFIEPLLQKSALDPLEFTNYWTISKLPCISKILEKVFFISAELSAG